MKLLQVQVAACGCVMDVQAAKHGAGSAWRDGTGCSSASSDWRLEGLKLSFSMMDGKKRAASGQLLRLLLSSNPHLPRSVFGQHGLPSKQPSLPPFLPLCLVDQEWLGLPVKAHG